MSVTCHTYKFFMMQSRLTSEALKHSEVDSCSFSCIVLPALLDKLPKSLTISMISEARNDSELEMEDFLVHLKRELEILHIYTRKYAKHGHNFCSSGKIN